MCPYITLPVAHGPRVSETCDPWDRGLLSWLRRYRICLQCRRPGFDPSVRKILWRREWQPTQYSCLEKSIDRGSRRSVLELFTISPSTSSTSHSQWPTSCFQEEQDTIISRFLNILTPLPLRAHLYPLSTYQLLPLGPSAHPPS